LNTDYSFTLSSTQNTETKKKIHTTMSHSGGLVGELRERSLTSLPAKYAVGIPTLSAMIDDMETPTCEPTRSNQPTSHHPHPRKQNQPIDQSANHHFTLPTMRFDSTIISPFQPCALTRT
jgi:hypothetical protein